MSKTEKKSAFAGAAAAANAAPLKQAEKPKKANDRQAKLLHIPTEYREAYETLKARGETAESYTAFIIEAFRQRLKTMGAL